MADAHEQLRQFWDADAATYDRSPSHAASDPAEAAVWRGILRRHLPPPPARVLDVGAGTGAMSLLAAELGHSVTALDLSRGMLARAVAKAEHRGIDLQTVVAPATEPPPGPFDAVIERHVIWTSPDPVAAMAAWRRSAPDGRLLVFEGIWHRRSPWQRVRGRVADTLRPLLGVSHDHHGTYGEALLASLPLARAMSPGPLLAAAADAGWRRISLERLRDVEWARRIAAPWPLGWLETMPHYAIIADA